MKIQELQKCIANSINGIENLVQGCCKAFAEDTRSVYDEAEHFVSTGGVAIVVVTPQLDRSGGNTEYGIPVEGEVLIRIIERVPLAKHKNNLRGLDAAEIIMHTLDGDGLEFKSMNQTSSPYRETITTTVTFNCAFVLTNN